ncbi:hypothetical protein FJV80_19820 [Mesorhizobium sp. WSM4310]|uniref:hypothetical protein n=1 Tax=Mesorhizobium sp. WSM4310 TaxID=2589883 RepID=UPI00115F0C3F|nr:hypothetical protein [Mesorhizobium sp. WSM4310]TRC83249.1 hypothetical protein FJV80_19820 [Mesorhizobium sp. WSM4310]
MALDDAPYLLQKVPSLLQPTDFFGAKSIVMTREDIPESVISLTFSRAKVRNLPMSFVCFRSPEKSVFTLDPNLAWAFQPCFPEGTLAL